MRLWRKLTGRRVTGRAHHKNAAFKRSFLLQKGWFGGSWSRRRVKRSRSR